MFIKQITYIAQLYILAKNELAKLASSKIHAMPGLGLQTLLRSTPLSQSIAFTMESGCPKLTVLHKLLVHIYFPYKIQTRPRARRTHPPTCHLHLGIPVRLVRRRGRRLPADRCPLALLFASLSGRSVETILLAGRPCRRPDQATDVYRLRLWCADPVCLYVIRSHAGNKMATHVQRPSASAAQ